MSFLNNLLLGQSRNTFFCVCNGMNQMFNFQAVLLRRKYHNKDSVLIEKQKQTEFLSVEQDFRFGFIIDTTVFRTQQAAHEQSIDSILHSSLWFHINLHTPCLLVRLAQSATLLPLRQHKADFLKCGWSVICVGLKLGVSVGGNNVD